ncbi:MAG: DNA-3-methyladenine glycosylase [Actinomycetota bacterium]
MVHATRGDSNSSIEQLLSGAAVDVAPAILGCILTTRLGEETTSVRITEVEAYGGSDDPASHAFRGRTRRNGSMFLPAGHLYTYRSYGIHMMANIVTGGSGDPGAVLLRAGEPVEGLDVMERRRGRTDHICDGPGKLAQALGLTLEHDGMLIGSGLVHLSIRDAPPDVVATPRIGISRATRRPWRLVSGA